MHMTQTYGDNLDLDAPAMTDRQRIDEARRLIDLAQSFSMPPEAWRMLEKARVNLMRVGR